MIQTRRKDDLVGVEPLGKVLFQFLRRGENLRPAFVLLLEARAEIFHLVLVARCRSPCRAASDIRASCSARAKRDMDMEIVRVVMNPVGVSDRVSRMKSLANFPIDLLHGGLQHAVRIDAGGNELVVQFARHGEDEAMLNDGILRGSGKFAEVVTPRFGDAFLSFLVVRQLAKARCEYRPR